MKLNRRSLVVVSVAAVIGCAGRTASGDDVDRSMVSMDSLRQNILRVLGDSSCTQASQCRSIPFGSKPCGGPWSYLVYSTNTADYGALADAVAEYNEREKLENEQEGRGSDCRIVSRPALDCVNSKCVAVR